MGACHPASGACAVPQAAVAREGVGLRGLGRMGRAGRPGGKLEGAGGWHHPHKTQLNRHVHLCLRGPLPASTGSLPIL